MTIDLYLMNVSAGCRAIQMTAKHLNIPLNLKNIDLMKGEQLTPEFLKLNPAHCIPTIQDGDLVLWESRAIMQYLVNKYSPNNSLYPTDPKKRALIDRTLNFDMSLYKSIGEAISQKVFRGIEPTEQQIENFKNNLKLLDTLVGNQKFLTGSELTLADLSVFASLTMLIINDYKDFAETPKLKAWFERLQKELPYYNEINGFLPDALKKFLAEKKQ